MTRFRALHGALACGALSLATGTTLQAAVTDYVIDPGATQSRVDNACVGAIPGATGEDCTYNQNFGGLIPWRGPIHAAGYYATGNSPFANDPTASPLPVAPVPDPNKVELAVTGTLQIDDVNGTACDADDTIAGRFELAAGTRTFSGGPGTNGEESWGDNTIVYVLPASTPDFVNDLGAAGCEYIFGSKGFPELIQTAGESGSVETYPVDLEIGAAPFDPNDGDQDVWAAPEPSGIGVGQFEGPSPGFDGNVGVRVNLDETVFYAGSWQCVDNFGDVAVPTSQVANGQCEFGPNSAGTPCDSSGSHFCGARGVGNPNFDPTAQPDDGKGQENWLIRIVVDPSGNIETPAQIFAHNESVVFTVPPAPARNNSWDGPLITFTASQPKNANDDAYVFTIGVTTAPQIQDIGANDENWAPNSAVVDDASGTLTGTGDQGGTFTITPDADIANVTAAYTPAAGFSGIETWVYRVTDAANSLEDTATVTVTVEQADAQPVANDLGGVVIDTQGINPADASTIVDVGPGGDIAGNELGNLPSTLAATQGTDVTTAVDQVDFLITITPATATTFTSAGDAISYTITDRDDESDTGTIAVSIPDVAPTVANDSQTVMVPGPVEIAVPFTPGNGAADDHSADVTGAQWGSVSNIEVNGTTAEIEFTYSPTGFGTTDVLTVSLTDGDGSVGSGTASITIAGDGVTIEQQDSLPGTPTAKALGPLGLGMLLLGIPWLNALRRKRRA